MMFDPSSATIDEPHFDPSSAVSDNIKFDPTSIVSSSDGFEKDPGPIQTGDPVINTGIDNTNPIGFRDTVKETINKNLENLGVKLIEAPERIKESLVDLGQPLVPINEESRLAKEEFLKPTLNFKSEHFLGNELKNILENESKKPGLRGQIAQTLLGTSEGGADLLSSFTSPENLALLPLTMLEGPAGKLIQSYFATQAITQAGPLATKLGEVSVTGDTQEIAKVATENAANATMAVLAGKGPIKEGSDLAATVRRARESGMIRSAKALEDMTGQKEPYLHPDIPVVARGLEPIRDLPPLPEPSQTEIADPTPTPDAGTTIVKPVQSQPEFVGMGGAVPAEFVYEKSVTGLQHEMVDAQRVARGESPIMRPLRKENQSVWDEATARVEADPNYQQGLIAELQKKVRPLDPVENMALTQHMVDLKNEYHKAMADAGRAKNDGRLEDFKSADRAADMWSNRLAELEKVTAEAGSASGSSLQARQQILNEDFSLASMTLRMRKNRNWEPLNAAEKTQLKSDFEKIRSSEESRAKYIATQKEAARAKSLDDELAKMREEVAKQPKFSVAVVEMADRILTTLDRRADAARVRLREKLSRASAGVDPTILIELSEIGAAHIARGVKNAGELTIKMVEEFGEAVRPFMAKVWAQANKVNEKLESEIAGPHAKKIRRVTKEKQSSEESLSHILDAVKEDPTDIAYVTRAARELAKLAIDRGIVERNAIVENVHSVLKDSIPELTKDRVEEALAGQGQFKPATTDPNKIILAQTIAELQKVTQLKEMEAGMPPGSYGRGRVEQTEEYRRLVKQVNEAKKKHGFENTDPEAQLKTSLDTRKTYVKNRMIDLRHEIKTRERIVKEKSLPPTDPELQSLLAEYESVKQEHQSVFGKRKVSEENRLKTVLAAAEKQEVIWNERLKRAQGGDFSTPVKTPRASNEKIEAIRARSQAIREHVKELRDLDPANQHEKAVSVLKSEKKALEKQIADREAKLSSGDLSTPAKKINRPGDPVLEPLIQKREALNKQISDLRKKSAARTPDEIATQRLQAYLKNREAYYLERIAKNDFGPKKKKVSVVTDPKAIELRAKVERAKNDFIKREKQHELANRSSEEKFVDAVIATSRGFILSGLTLFTKLGFAAAGRVLSTGVDALIGGVINKIPGIRTIAKQATYEGRMSPRAIAAGVMSLRKGLKDAWSSARTGESDWTHAYGKPHEQLPGKYHAVMAVSGRLHAMIKAPIKRAIFELSYVNGMLWNEARGVDVTNPIEQLRISHEAYIEADRSIFQDNNIVAEGIKSFERKRIDKETGKETGGSLVKRTVVGTVIPIRKVPANIVSEALNYGPVGAAIGSVKAARVLSKNAEGLTSIQADQIMRHLKKGSAGSAVMLLGWYAYENAGGFYQPGKKKKELKPGDAKIGNVTVDHNLLHFPIMSPFQFGAMLHQEYQRTGSASSAVGSAIIGLLSDAPLARETADIGKLRDPNRRGTFAGDWVRSRLIPKVVEQAARSMDKNASGEVNERDPKGNILDNLKTAIPGMRNSVALKKNKFIFKFK